MLYLDKPSVSQKNMIFIAEKP